MKIHHGRAWRVGLMLSCLGAMAAVQAQEQAQERAAGQEGAVKTLPAQVKEDVEAIAAQLLKVQDSDSELACGKAVENARYGMETMLEVGQRNRDGGYLSAAEFDRSAAPIKQRLATTTLADCQSAQGKRLDFIAACPATTTTSWPARRWKPATARAPGKSGKHGSGPIQIRSNRSRPPHAGFNRVRCVPNRTRCATHDAIETPMRILTALSSLAGEFSSR